MRMLGIVAFTILVAISLHHEAYALAGGLSIAFIGLLADDIVMEIRKEKR